MSKILATKYHSQLNNTILPYVSCGTTSLANYLQWLNIKFGTSFECDDDNVMKLLNSQPMIDKAKELVKKGVIDSAALEFRVDNPKTPNINEANFNHANNFKEMLVAVANYITNGTFIFKVEYLSIDEIKASIDSDFPVIISAKFTSGGHFVQIVGYDESNWICDDPYGSWNTGYKTDESGAKVLYNRAKVDMIFTFAKREKGLNGKVSYQCIRACKA